MKIIKVALPVGVHNFFEYKCPFSEVKVGMRVLVNFRNRNIVGFVVGFEDNSSLPANKIKNVLDILDKEPLLQEAYIDFLLWVSKYYHEPLGMVFSTAMPSLLKKQDSSSICENYSTCGDPKKLSKKQKELYTLIANSNKPISNWDILSLGFREKSIQALIDKNVIEIVAKSRNEPFSKYQILSTDIVPNAEQKQVTNEINKNDSFASFLLEGITGSGKTQVYLDVITKILLEDKQVLVLLPEIGLTPQTVQRFRDKFSIPITILHSGLSDLARLSSWMKAATGEAKLVIGTRSAIFAQMPNLGLIIVDEEHDASFKQQSGLRYSARDLAVVRAKINNIKVVLGTATPALESYYNVSNGRYQHLELPNRAGIAKPPTTKIIDMRSKKLQYGLAPDVINSINNHLKRENQVLVFLNRRGFCPVIFCHSCGWTAKCERCDNNYTLHKSSNMLVCHLCNAKRPLYKECSKCSSEELHEVGVGTEKLAQGLRELYPETLVTRIDRDAISSNVALDDLLQTAYAGKSQIIVGTQMLAKGHHIPKITLVVVADADGALYSSDFRAVEKLVQTLVQVSGRAGRADLPGEVLVQTHFPDNKFLQAALGDSYKKFANIAMKERKESVLPPYGSLALLNAEATRSDIALGFLQNIISENIAHSIPGVSLIGPMLANQHKKSGKYRANLIIHALHKSTLHRFIYTLRTYLDNKKTYSAKWFLDIDPHEII